jgi:hypothetical protein
MSIFCGSLFNPGSAIEAADFIQMKTSTYKFSYEKFPLRSKLLLWLPAAALNPEPLNL